MHDDIFNPNDRMLRQFAAIWIVFFGGMAAWQQFYRGRPVVAMILALAAITIGPLGLASPRAIRPVFVGWMTLVYPIGWIVSRTVLGALFYGLFTPIAVAFRLLGRDELKLKPQPTATSYWVIKPRPNDKGQYLRQF
jgi:hypothetical protein